MPESDDISQITLEETWMLRYWHNVSNLIREDIAYIWTEDAQKALKDMKTEAGRITLLLRRIHRRKKANLLESRKRANFLRSKEGHSFWVDRHQKLQDINAIDRANARGYEELKAMREFIHALNHLEAKKKWVREIDEDIRQIIGELEAEKADLRAIEEEQITGKEKAKRFAINLQYRRRFAVLRELGFNTTRFRSLALFFVRHWDSKRSYRRGPEDVRRFDCKDSFLMFSRGIQAIADLINEDNWPELLRLAGKTDYEIKYEVIAYTLPCLKPLIQELGLKKVVDGVIYLSSSNKWHDKEVKKTFFGRSLPSVKDLINKDTWPSLIEMAEADGGYQLFAYGLPAVRDIFNQTTLPGLVKLAKQGKSHYLVPLFYVFSKGIHSVKHIINDRTWPDIVAGFEKLIGLGDTNVFEYTLPGLKGIITEENWLAIVHEICDIHKQSKEATTFDHAHIHKAFRYVAHIVDEQTRPLVFDELLQTYLLFEKKERHFYTGDQDAFEFGIAAVESILTKTNFPIIFGHLRKGVEESKGAATLFSILFGIKNILREQNLSTVIDDINGSTFYGPENTVSVALEHIPIESEADWRYIMSVINYSQDSGSSSLGFAKCFFGCVLPALDNKINKDPILVKEGVSILQELTEKVPNEKRGHFFVNLGGCQSLFSDFEGLSVVGLISVEIYKKAANLTDYLDDHIDVFKQCVQSFLSEIPEEERASDKLPSILKKVVTYDKIKFVCAQGFFQDTFSDEELKSVVGKLDLRVLTTKHPEDVKELIKTAHNLGEKGYFQWYIRRNWNALKNLRRLGIRMKLWLGYEQLHLVERVVSPGISDVTPAEYKQRAIADQAQNFSATFNKLFSAEVIPDQDEREKLYSTIADKAASVLSISVKQIPSIEAFVSHCVQNPDKIPEVVAKAIMPKIQSDEKMEKIVDPDRKDSFFGSRGELEQIAQSIKKILSGKGEKAKMLDISFNISRKSPLDIKVQTRWKSLVKGVSVMSHFTQPSVLTIGNDGGCCVAMGGANEFAGYNFFLDSDALLINIMDKNKKRVGMILAFAALEGNQPILALNTVETPFRSDTALYPIFCDVCMQMLSTFAHVAGFKKIVIGKGYGSDYFNKAYEEIDIDMKKMNPFKTERQYYTNAFETGNIEDTPKGKVLYYKGKGVLIWDESMGIMRNKLAQDSIQYAEEFKTAA